MLVSGLAVSARWLIAWLRSASVECASQPMVTNAAFGLSVAGLGTRDAGRGRPITTPGMRSWRLHGCFKILPYFVRIGFESCLEREHDPSHWSGAPFTRWLGAVLSAKKPQLKFLIVPAGDLLVFAILAFVNLLIARRPWGFWEFLLS